MPRMDKLSLACAVISKEKRDQIVERIKRKDGSVSARTFLRGAFEIDRLKTALHEAAHVVVGFLLGRRLGPEGVELVTLAVANILAVDIAGLLKAPCGRVPNW